MTSSPITPATRATSSGTTSLPTTAPSSPPSEHAGGTKAGPNGGTPAISDDMLKEEEAMAKETLQEEEEEETRLRVEREKNLGGNEKEVRAKMNSTLQFMLDKSEIYSAFMREKIQKARDAKAAEESKAKKPQKSATANGTAAVQGTAGKRTSTRAASMAGTDSADAQQAEKVSTKGKRSAKKLPAHPKAKKSAGVDIAEYFRTSGLESKKGHVSVTEALEQAAEEEVDLGKFGAKVSLSARQPDLVTGGVMREYQLEGLEWLTSLYENGVNGILADEMGLGKTIQTIAFLAFLRSKGTYGPFLVAAPLSTLSNWVEEFARWTPSVPVILYHGSKPEREELRRTRLFKQKTKETFPVVCTSYEISMNDRKYLADMGWKFIIIDEGHRLKNLNCRLIRELKSYDSANRLLITGTPLQNDLAELWSLLNFLMPELFDDFQMFQGWFDFSALKEKDGHRQILSEERQNKIVSSLHAILKPFLLRRVKADVETSLPKKREYILYAPLSTEQKELYREILQGDSRAYLVDKAVKRLSASGSSAPVGTTSSTGKRKAASATTTPNKSAKSSRSSTPASDGRGLRAKKRRDYREAGDNDSFEAKDHQGDDEVDDEDQEELEQAKTLALAKREIAGKKLQNPVMQLRLTCDSPHNFYWPWKDDQTPDSTLVTESGKMMLLNRLLPALFDRGHKVLIFSQFKTQLNIVHDWAELMNGWNVCRIDGQVKQADRREQIKAFNTDPEHRLFLLSTRAGGQGINLAAADTVILFDSDWNPQQDLQAQDRAHRIGQTRPVIVYRLATKGTIEQTLLEKADGKRRLEKIVMQKNKFKDLLSKSQDDIDELQRLLTEDDFEKYDVGHGAHILSERDLEVLMDRSDEAYQRAEKGLDGGEGFKVVETKKEHEALVDVSK